MIIIMIIIIIVGAVEEDVVRPDADPHAGHVVAALEGLLDAGVVLLAVDA